MRKYESLSQELTKRILNDRADPSTKSLAFDESKVVRRNNDIDRPNVWRTAFIRDVDKIMHCPYYNRYADKTQVFSLYKNDDITRRGLHVQLVSRIARTIGKALNLNQDLIEAIAIGHDIGHTPFGHAGESYLDEMLSENTGRRFSHNIHSVRVLDSIFPYNISLQTLNGIASHDGELELSHYAPKEIDGFYEFDKQIELCYIDKNNVKSLVPCTLEGCVVRISDIIAYLGKDRQDAQRAGLLDNNEFKSGAIGSINAEIINNLIVNIIENSYGNNYIKMDNEHFSALSEAKSANYSLIYKNEKVNGIFETTIRKMFRELYTALLNDLKSTKKSSPIYTHHIDYISNSHYARSIPYIETEPNQMVTDYIASMTDDYFLDLYSYMFPSSTLKVNYVGYFK